MALDTPAVAPATSSPASASSSRGDYSVVVWLVMATFTVILNETIMINALPTLMREFDVNERTAQWLSAAFMLTMAVIIPVTGWFLQRVTTRQAFGLAMATFLVGTALAGLAPTFGVLLVARIIQAAGTAVMFPLLMTTVMTVVPERDRGRVMGNVTLAMSVAPAMGPTLSGVILEFASWRWMFGLVFPVAGIVSYVGFRKLTNVGESAASPLDVVSVALAVVGFGPLVYGLSELGGENGNTVPLGCLTFGVMGVAVFVARQLHLQRSDRPLLDLRTFRHRTFTIAMVMLSAAFMAMIGSMILMPLYLQKVLDLSVLNTGLLMMPGGLAMGLLGPTVGRWFDTYGARPLVIPGSIGMLAALVMFTQVQATTSQWYVLAAHVLLMVSLALTFTPAFTLRLGAVPQTLYSHASSLVGTSQQVAAAAGTAICVAVLSWRSDDLMAAGASDIDALVGGMRWGFAVGAVLAVAVLTMAVLLPGRLPATEES